MNGKDEKKKKIHFDLNRIGSWSCPGYIFREFSIAMADMHRFGMMPLEEDGKPAGNLALKVPDGLIVARSDRNQGALKPQDLVKIIQFDHKEWCARYVSTDEAALPPGDTALYWAALMEAPFAYRWSNRPRVLLHGYSIRTEEDAQKYNIPLSRRTTMPGTPDDVRALGELMKRYPYPQQRIYMRRNHGFFVLGSAVLESFRFALDYLHLEDSSQASQLNP